MTVTRKAPGRFHHGDLRRALLDAVAEAVMEVGPEGISLRDCARRAGVAHSAAAPHFGDKRGLLTAFAAEGFERLGRAQDSAMAAAAGEPAAQLAAAGRGYLAFARDNPGHFRLMWRSSLLDNEDPTLEAARHGAWEPLERAVVAATPGLAPAAQHERMAMAWSTVHGFAALAAEGAGPILRGEATDAEALEALLDRLVAAVV